ncbi:Unknown protein [Striga hermonthica]|uniref:GRF-type domain-containing protein n=1 Tax=Striga hermonthica TaxID=68872 RepID=A0A9N7R9N0_STRHE|nr:Unknown protein [Striga hermonthica]
MSTGSSSYRKTSSAATFPTTTFPSSANPILECKHREKPDLLTSHTDLNPARRYYRCKYRMDDDCQFFAWFDPELPPYQKASYLKLKGQVQVLEEQLKCKVFMEKLLSERLEVKDNELDLLKRKNADLENNIATMDQRRKSEKNLLILVTMFLLAMWFFGVSNEKKLMLM